MSTRTFQVTLAAMVSGRCQVSLPTKEEMIAGVEPEVGLILETFTLNHGRPTVITHEELTQEEQQLAAQLVYNTLAVHAATVVAEATQKTLDKLGQTAVPASSFPQGGASA